MYKTCGTLAANIYYVLVFLMHDKVIVEFGRKVFLVDCLLWEKNTLNMAKMSGTERTQAFSCTRKLQV